MPCACRVDNFCFNTQPPEGGCLLLDCRVKIKLFVSTHSHPKAAAFKSGQLFTSALVSTHSHPKAAANPFTDEVRSAEVSTHSHPKAAAF